MTITIPTEQAQAVAAAARERKISVDDYIREAVNGQLRLEAALQDELTAWQEARDEALQLVEDAGE